MAVVEFLRHLLARGSDMLTIRGNNVVAAVGRGIVDGFVLAHQSEGDAGSDAAKGERC